MDLTGRSAIVAGGAGGLGGATVRRLASRGVGVLVLDPDVERSGALVDELGDRVAVDGDSNDDDAVGVAIDRARSLGTLSIAVSATGVVIPSRRLVDSDGSVLAKEALLANLELHVVRPVQPGEADRRGVRRPPLRPASRTRSRDRDRDGPGLGCRS